MASNTFSASGSQRCQALRKTAHEKLRPKYNKCFTKAKKFLFSNNLPYLFSGIVVIKLFKVLSIWAAGGRTDYILPEGPPIIYISAIECKKKISSCRPQEKQIVSKHSTQVVGSFYRWINWEQRTPEKKKQLCDMAIVPICIHFGVQDNIWQAYTSVCNQCPFSCRQYDFAHGT